MRDLLPVTDSDRFLALTSIAFDISLLELLFPLFVGATVYVLEEGVRTQPDRIAQAIEESGISIVQATPSTFQMLKAIDWNPSKPLVVLCGGEPLLTPLAQFLFERASTLYNVYGPTETTIWASLARVSNPQSISLGVPLHGTSYFVLNDELRPVPAGGVGELVIEGDLVASGYTDPSRNAPFLTLPGRTAPAYRTGDLVRYLGNGNLVYVGRKDNQIKLNGFRIELSEIEKRLEKFFTGGRFIAVLRGYPDKHICCFYLNSDSVDLTVESLDRFF